ncbi:hypothetical protein ABIC89_003312 [Variovorax boronicumulans]
MSIPITKGAATVATAVVSARCACAGSAQIYENYSS